MGVAVSHQLCALKVPVVWVKPSTKATVAMEARASAHDRSASTREQQGSALPGAIGYCSARAGRRTRGQLLFELRESCVSIGSRDNSRVLFLQYRLVPLGWLLLLRMQRECKQACAADPTRMGSRAHAVGSA